jgi:hypothetical protein
MTKNEQLVPPFVPTNQVGAEKWSHLAGTCPVKRAWHGLSNETGVHHPMHGQ